MSENLDTTTTDNQQQPAVENNTNENVEQPKADAIAFFEVVDVIHTPTDNLQTPPIQTPAIANNDVQHYYNDKEAVESSKRKSYTIMLDAKESKYMDANIEAYVEAGVFENNNQVLRYLVDVGLHYTRVCEANRLKIPFITPVPDGKDGSKYIEPILFKNSLFKDVCKLKSF